MEHGANQFINNERQRSNHDIFAMICDRLDRLDRGQDNGELKNLIIQNRELETSGNYRLARIEDMRQRTRAYVGGRMTEVQNYEMIQSYYNYLDELNRRNEFDVMVGNVAERRIHHHKREMLNNHTKKIGPKRRIKLGMDPWSKKFEHTLEFDGEAVIKTFDDCIVYHFTVSGIDLYETVKKLLVECQKAGCTRQQLADIIYTLVAKEMPVVANSIKRRNDNPNLMLDSLYELYTQDETLRKVLNALEREKRTVNQDIAIFGARIRELLIHKYTLSQPGLSERAKTEKANKIAQQYILDVVDEAVKRQVLIVVDKRNKEGLEVSYAEFVACIHHLEEIEGGKHKPTTTLYVKKGVGHERTAFLNNGIQRPAPESSDWDLEDLTLIDDSKKKKDSSERKSRGRERNKKKPDRRSGSGSNNRSGRSASRNSRNSSYSSQVSSRNSSRASSRNSFSRGRSTSAGSRSSRSGSRQSRAESTGSRASTPASRSQERDINFNTDSKRRANKPNKENYNKNRSKKSDDKPQRSKTHKSDKPRVQKICATCIQHNKCPIGKCLKYPKDADWTQECTRCKRGCHQKEHCKASKN